MRSVYAADHPTSYYTPQTPCSVCLCDVTRPCGVYEHRTRRCIRIAYFKNALSYLFIIFYEYYEYMHEICKFKSDIFIVLILSCHVAFRFRRNKSEFFGSVVLAHKQHSFDCDINIYAHKHTG